MRKATFMFFAAMAITFGALFYITDKDDFVPYEKVLARQMKYTTFHKFHDKNFNTEIDVPGIFLMEEDTCGIAYSHARFAFYPEASHIDAKGQIVIEYCASVSTDKNDRKENVDSTPHPNDYVTYEKTIRRQKMQFSYSVTYPYAYEGSMSRIKQKVYEWKAFCHDSINMKNVETPRRKRARKYHSGSSVE